MTVKPIATPGLLELAENRLFGAAKRIARTMGARFVLNERGQELVKQEADKIARGETP